MFVIGGTSGIGVLGAEKTILGLGVEVSRPNLAVFTSSSILDLR